jgi:hypothetical protein
MQELIKQNLKDENYILTLFNRIMTQRNDALNTVSLLETEIIKANQIINNLNSKLDSSKSSSDTEVVAAEVTE